MQRMSRLRRGLLAAAMLSLAASSALAHGAHKWIMEHPEASWCCGPKDCFTIPRGSVRETWFGWRFVYKNRTYVVRRKHPGLFLSVDADYHACFDSSDDLRCFFHPVGAV